MDRRSPTQIARLRLPWLLGTMAIELGAGAIIARFDAVLRDVILLASFMPVISAVSGNVGLQAAAIVVRGLDTGHVSLENWGHAVRRELIAALSIAAVAGAVLAVVAIVWSRHLPFGIVVGAAMTCAIVAAGLMGTIIPMLSKRLGFDPAMNGGSVRDGVSGRDRIHRVSVDGDAARAVAAMNDAKGALGFIIRRARTRRSDARRGAREIFRYTVQQTTGVEMEVR